MSEPGEVLPKVERGDFARRVQRARNAFRRVRRGLPLRTESVCPDCPTDLFMAHVSVYWFATRFVRGRRVLDLGCGTGYGTSDLLHAGATEVVGVDLDPKSVRYARRRYKSPGLSFHVGDAQRLSAVKPDLGRFDVILSSNVFEYLEDLPAALDEVRRHLVPNGRFLLVIPPIADQETLEANRRNPLHRTNLFVEEWARMLGERFGWLRAFEHVPRPGIRPDFTDPFPSALTPMDFEFFEVPVRLLGTRFTLGAMFLAEVPLAPQESPREARSSSNNPS